MKPDQKSFCLGCDSEYYNHDDHSNTGECWNFKRAKLIPVYSIGW